MRFITVSLVFLFSLPCLPSAAGEAVALRAEKEVTVSKSPIKLTLRLHKTKLKRIPFLGSKEFRVAEPLHYQLTLQNIGTGSVPADEGFRNPGNMRTSFNRIGTLLEIVGPDGSAPPPQLGEHVPPGCAGNFVTAEDRRAAEKDIAAWKREGLSENQITRRLIDRKLATPEEHDDVVILHAGESITTVPWAYQRASEACRGKPEPEPKGQFAEMYGYVVSKPGKYRIRAVYDIRLTKEERAEYAKRKIPIEPWRTRAETPWIEFSVSP